MNTNSPVDDDALEGPIFPTFIRYMMPTLLGLIAMTSGSLVDGMFIGNYIERDGETLALALEFVAYIWPVFIFAGFTMWISGYLKAVHLPFQSALVASCRSLIMPAGFLILFYMLLSDYRFVAAISAAEAISFVIAVTLFIYHTPNKHYPRAGLREFEGRVASQVGAVKIKIVICRFLWSSFRVG